MISGISNALPIGSVQGGTPTAPKPPANKPANPAEDTVHLSAAAKALGDADHDGDSH